MTDENLIAAINNIAKAIPVPPSPYVEAFALLIVGAVIAGLVAFGFNHLHWKMKSRQSEVAHMVERILAQISILEEMGVAYWLEGFSTEQTAQHQANEIRIKSAFRLMLRYLDLLGSICRKNSKHNVAMKSLNKINGNLYDVITGADFESSNRLPCKPTAAKISRKCADAKGEISKIALMSLK
jgi:uncharacterized membrane protein YgaE (UPF0421/DUF939 family)